MARRHFARAMPEVVDAVLDEARRVAAEAVQSPSSTAQRLSGPFGMVPQWI